MDVEKPKYGKTEKVVPKKMSVQDLIKKATGYNEYECNHQSDRYYSAEHAIE